MRLMVATEGARTSAVASSSRIALAPNSPSTLCWRNRWRTSSTARSVAGRVRFQATLGPRAQSAKLARSKRCPRNRDTHLKTVAELTPKCAATACSDCPWRTASTIIRRRRSSELFWPRSILEIKQSGYQPVHQLLRLGRSPFAETYPFICDYNVFLDMGALVNLNTDIQRSAEATSHSEERR